MSNGDGSYDRINDFDAVKISLANPKKIREESKGEVKKPETINYRTYRPERDGLFCEKIFGPEKDWECACGKYRGMKYKGMTCDRCGVKITHSRVRRKRMGHIELAAPVVHIWFFKAASSRLATLLAMKSTSLEKVIYFQDYVVTDPGDTPLKPQALLTEEEYRKALEEYGDSFKAEMGAEAVRKLLQRLNVTELSRELRQELQETKSKQRKKDLINRLKLVEALRNCPSENRPEWMILDVIPVIPPDLRPLVLLDSGTFATSDLNDLYRRIINRNNRLKKLVDLNAPEVIIRNEKRMLQQSVDALFDNMRCKRQVLGSSNRPLKSLTDMIKGKQGRFRENLLGKRVDYSARSVIVVGPTMRLHQCGLPKKIALELYQPFIIRRLRELQHADTIKSAKKMLERKDEEVWDILEEVIQNHPVLLNRAPTLHRMGIQAFEPMLIEGNAIKLHPLVCKGFNADFDGDQMAVHLPLSLEAQVEAHTLMLSTNNIFSPANGKPIISPSQDIVMGCYYITMELPGMRGEGMKFSSKEEVLLAHALGKVHLQAKIFVRMSKGRWLQTDPSIREGMLFETTPGRLIFNEILPEGMPFYNIPLKSKELATVISNCHELLGRRATIDLLDNMMRLGFQESTKSGLSFASDDLITPKAKKEIIANGDKEVKRIQDQYDNGQLSAEERYNKILDIWSVVRDEVTKKMLEELENDTRTNGYVNPIFLMKESGARGGAEQIRQLAGIRGLMAKPNGKIIETPVKANFREGLNVLEYFSSTHGARKGLADTALKTADSGYLTRKLADVAQNIVVTTYDCGTTMGVLKGAIYQGGALEPVVSLVDAIRGRVSRANITNAVTDEVIVRENELITTEIANKIKDMGIEKIQVRSPMTCEAELGVCALCYGMDLSTGKLVEEGMAVGTIAAQSIGEPGTQLTMRTFHIGGTAAHGAEESEIKTKYAGFVRFHKLEIIDHASNGVMVLSCKNDAGVAICNSRGQAREIYSVPEGAILTVQEGQEVAAETTLCTMDPHSKLILAKASGTIHFGDIIDGDTSQTTVDPATGQLRRTIVDLKGDRQPHIDIKTPDGIKVLEDHYLPGKSQIEVEDGQTVVRGTIIAKTPRNASGTQDITSGLPRVTEIFEARKPKDPAIIAEIDGFVEIGDKRHGKRTIIVRSDSSFGGEVIERIHEVPHGKHINVHNGDEVRAGQPLTDGLLVPHDILRVSGEDAVQEYLTQEIQNIYRMQNVVVNDKHIEIIVAQMLRKVRIENGGDTSLLEGETIDKFEFRNKNREIESCVKITEAGDTDFQVGEIVPKDIFESKNIEFEANGGKPAQGKKPTKAVASTQLLGITKAAVQSSSFLSAASFQETTKVLTEAALAYKIDHLVGLKENVILGRLVPAGTGFRKYQNAQWRYRQEASDALQEMQIPLEAVPSFNLLNDIPETEIQNSIFNTDDDSIPAFPSIPDELDSDSKYNDELLNSGFSKLFIDDEKVTE
ncbi:MAG: DNA-directed RNA polymerase subunit beta' [Planctomycetia bacterium]|nr:DNA-directed RNA polymerase subunit beta' [Planctomycetia bacterium]